jgi:hypothetical protein
VQDRLVFYANLASTTTNSYLELADSVAHHNVVVTQVDA